MNLLKLWPVPVLAFCIYCLHTLVADSYEVLYLKGNETDPLRFLACLDLSRICTNKTEINLKELGDDLYDHFNSSEDYRDNRRIYRREFELTLNRTKFGGYLVLNRRVCLIANDWIELGHIIFFLSSKVYRPVLFAMKSDTFDFGRMEQPWDQIDQLIVVKKEHPSDCDQSNGRFLCLNECFRRRFRLSRYLYHGNETGSILLHFSESNRTIQESERICFAQCKRENCKLVQMILVSEPESEPQTIEAEPVLNAFDFWLQIVGLIFSFVGLFFDQFASTATKLTKKLTRSKVRRRKVKVALFYLNLAIILLSLAYYGYLCVRVALEWQADVNLQEREKTRNLIHPKTVRLAICVIMERYEYQGKTMLEIEKATDRSLDKALEGIYVSDGGRSFRTDYHVHRKILFWDRRRCFSLSIQPNYQTIPSRPILSVRLKENAPYSQLYVLSEEENLNRESFQYYFYAFQKRIVRRLKSRGCANYTEKYGNCIGRENCVERCIARKFIEMYNGTTFGIRDHRLVIDRDWFSPSEWNTSRLMDSNKSLYHNLSKECFKISKKRACDEATFKKTFEIKQPDNQAKEIDLQFDVVHSAEELPYSLRMALDLLGIQSIFFGFTLLQLFWLIYQFTKPRWRLRNKTDKVIWFIVCLLASIGCSWTTVRMLDEIVNGELVPIEHFEVAKRIQIPAMVFCLRINQKLIDRNHQLTGSYLEELTANITTESTFKSIFYLNESNNWTLFDLRRVERFFFLNMKCFKVNIEEKYSRNQFHFSDYTQVLRMNFNETSRFVHFMTKSKEASEFSKILNLDYVEKIDIVFGQIKLKYRVIHEPTLYEYEDRFGFFRTHFPPLPEGDVGNLRGQLLELQSNEPNRRTLSLPVEEEHFGLEVDEDHFEQLYSVQKRKNSNKRTNLNYRQMFVTNHFREGFGSDFTFDLVFLQRVVHFTNEVNYATLTLALLNLFSLWLELVGLDLRPFLLLLPRRLIKILLSFYRWLKRLKPQLYELIDSQRKEEEDENSPDNSSTSDLSSSPSVASVT